MTKLVAWEKYSFPYLILLKKVELLTLRAKIETAACVINVLTIHNEMRSKGIQRNYWEGGYFGEGGF